MGFRDYGVLFAEWTIKGFGFAVGVLAALRIANLVGSLF